MAELRSLTKEKKCSFAQHLVRSFKQRSQIKLNVAIPYMYDLEILLAKLSSEIYQYGSSKCRGTLWWCNYSPLTSSSVLAQHVLMSKQLTSEETGRHVKGRSQTSVWEWTWDLREMLSTNTSIDTSLIALCVCSAGQEANRNGLYQLCHMHLVKIMYS